MQGISLQFPLKQAPIGRVSYAGRLLALNVEKATRFSCGGFFVGTANPVAMVSPDAQMDRIHAAVLAGILSDVTDSHGDMKVGGSVLKAADVEQTDRKTYIKFQLVPNAMGGRDIIIVGHEGVEGAEAQQEYEKKQVKGMALVLPPGMDDPDKYLLKADSQCK